MTAEGSSRCVSCQISLTLRPNTTVSSFTNEPQVLHETASARLEETNPLFPQFSQLHPFIPFPGVCHLISVLAGVRGVAPRGEISTGRKRAVIMKRPRAERAHLGLLISILIRRIRAGRSLMTSQVTVGVCK